MEIKDCGDGTFEITETVSEINARAVAAGLPPPIVIIEMHRHAKDMALCTKITAEEARLRGITPNDQDHLMTDSVAGGKSGAS